MINLENKYGGEMTVLERSLLHTWILEANPKIVLEIGTGTGGGGTYYISKAMPKDGFVYTCDPYRCPDKSFFEEFPMVVFWNTSSEKLIHYMIDNKIDIDFIFFDGPEDENTAMDDILLLETHLKKGAKFSMHDWEFVVRVFDNNISIKSKNIRPYMEKSNKWKLIHQTQNSNASVGLCLYEFVGETNE